MKTPAQFAFDPTTSIAAMTIPVAVPIDGHGDAAAPPPPDGRVARPPAPVDGVGNAQRDDAESTSVAVLSSAADAGQSASTATGRGVGDTVLTPYGLGKIEEYRDVEGIYVVRMDGFGATLYTSEAAPVEVELEAKKKKNKNSMELNAAYEALETMRRLNLEMECHEAGIVFDGAADPELMCKTCLLEGRANRNRFSRLQKFVDDRETESTMKLRRMWARGTGEEGKDNPKVLPRIQKLMEKKERSAASPCLICAHRCCARHCSASFRKEGITLCSDCEQFFELDFIVECVSNTDSSIRRKSVDHMIDLYDRCLLLLNYSSQFVDGITESLEKRAQRTDKIGLGSSGAGVVSGALGVAAAATILSPAGPPLLIASLVFGGSATAVQTGAEARGYFSEPRRLADRIIALHGMAHSVLRVAGTLRDACCMDHIRTEAYVMSEGKLSPERLKKSLEKNEIAIKAGAKVTTGAALSGAIAAESAAVASAEAGVLGARTSAALTRAGTATARAMRFARFAGGALSAAVLVLEAKNIDSTLKSIKAGSPCDKADALRGIMEELEELPLTEQLDNECQAYLRVLDQQHGLAPVEGCVEDGEPTPPTTAALLPNNCPKVDV